MNTRFSTYASYWIKQSIKRALVNSAKTIRIPAYMVELLTKWRRATTKLQDELGRPPTHRRSRQVTRTAAEEAEHRQEGDPASTTRRPQTDRPETGWSLGDMRHGRTDQGARTTRWSRTTT